MPFSGERLKFSSPNYSPTKNSYLTIRSRIFSAESRTASNQATVKFLKSDVKPLQATKPSDNSPSADPTTCSGSPPSPSTKSSYRADSSPCTARSGCCSSAPLRPSTRSPSQGWKAAIPTSSVPQKGPEAKPRCRRTRSPDFRDWPRRGTSRRSSPRTSRPCSGFAWSRPWESLEDWQFEIWCLLIGVRM